MKIVKNHYLIILLRHSYSHSLVCLKTYHLKSDPEKTGFCVIVSVVGLAIST